ncbi:hypothetical protein [Chryseobacterium sp. EO14]|uniref:hypothetical protein n=1 Tax=Chryseobacterium sp. EO14 TaxID=2950551 RepID=UPI00210A1041|nr:hypothetical protein [Chryseobacterium sp. EO14]MCQ4140439.1 hypothetical protein [Chryseobacterium sp. EO14]
MIKALLFFITFIFGLCFLSCIKENREISQPEKITVDENLSKNDTFKILSKHPELKLFNSEKVESLTRTAHIVQEDGYYESFSILEESNTDFFSSAIINAKLNTKETPSIFGLTITTDILETEFW